MRGHNTVMDGWAGAANPHLYSTPRPIPFPTQTYTQKASKILLSPLFNSHSQTDQWTDGWMDRRTDGWTDKASYRVACPQLKIYLEHSLLLIKMLF